MSLFVCNSPWLHDDVDDTMSIRVFLRLLFFSLSPPVKSKYSTYKILKCVRLIFRLTTSILIIYRFFSVIILIPPRIFRRNSPPPSHDDAMKLSIHLSRNKQKYDSTRLDIKTNWRRIS